MNFGYSETLPEWIESCQPSIVHTHLPGRRGGDDRQWRREAAGGFSHVPQAMGMTGTPSGLAMCSRDAVWGLPANLEIADQIEPEAGHDIALLVRNAHFTGPVMGHDLICGGDVCYR